MARENTNPEEFITVLDNNGEETEVTRQAFEDVWKEKGYSLPKKSAASDDKPSKSS